MPAFGRISLNSRNTKEYFSGDPEIPLYDRRLLANLMVPALDRQVYLGEIV